MEKLTTLTGVGVPLRRSNVDTDQIIPAVFLKRVTKSGFDDALFYAWRRDPNFVLNKPEYAGKGQILVAGPEFGIGSSRRASPTSSTATPPRTACWPRLCRRSPSNSCGSYWRKSLVVR